MNVLRLLRVLSMKRVVFVFGMMMLSAGVAQAGVLTTLNFGSDGVDSGQGPSAPPGVYCPPSGGTITPCFKDKAETFAGQGTIEHVTLTATISNSFSLIEPSLYLAHAGLTVHLYEALIHGTSTGAGSVTITFDDLAAAPLPTSPTLASGTFRPDSPLSALNGLDASGTWILTIGDWNPGDISSYSGAVLAVTTPEPATLALLVVGLAVLSGSVAWRKGRSIR